MKIGYFADGPWSHMAVKKIFSDKRFLVKFICARFDNPDPELKKIAKLAGIPFRVHKDINDVAIICDLQKYNCDTYVSMSFNQIFKQRIIGSVRGGIINCHAGKLPFYRGRNVLNWALINGENEFGITVHHVDEGVDSGDIIIQKTYPITDNDDYETLLSRSYLNCSDLLYKALVRLATQKYQRIIQKDIHPHGFYCVQRKLGDEVIDWCQSSRDIFNFIRAISYPGPSARTFCRNDEIKLNKSELIPDAPSFKGIPGSVLYKDRIGILVKTLDSYIKISEWESLEKINVGDRWHERISNS